MDRHQTDAAEQATPIAVAATWTLVCGAMVFVLALNALWSDSELSTKR
jgi:hypothetical protein